MAKFKETSMAAIFQNQAERLGDKPCVAYKKDGKYIDISWNEMNEMVHNLAYYLLSVGVKKGEKIGLFSQNRYEWWVTDLAILSIGAVNIPIYSTNSAEEAEYVLENSESTMCFCGTLEHLDKVLKVKKKLKKLKTVVAMDPPAKKKASVITFEQALEKGKKYKTKGNFDKKLKAIKPGDLATLIYTSGTTGNPKGVMLTHNNFVSNVKNTLADIKHLITEDDTFLSFLPLSHSLERMAGMYTPIYCGARVAFAEDISTLMDNFQEVRPTVMISVPRIYEKIHSGILAKVADASAVKKGIFNFAINTAKKNLPYMTQDKERTLCQAVQHRGQAGLL